MTRKTEHPKAANLKPGLLVSLYPSTATVESVERVNGRVRIRLNDGTEHERMPDELVKSFGAQKSAKKGKRRK